MTEPTPDTNLSTAEHTQANADKVKGYKKLTPRQIELIDRIKTQGNEVGALISDLIDEPGIDQRWLAIANTDLQKAFMPLVRAVAKPDFF